MEETLKLVNEEIIDKLDQTNNIGAKVIAKEIKKYNQMLQIDIEMAIICARKSLDLILRNACEMIDIKPGTKPLENIIVDLNREGIIPPIIEKHCRIIKDFGNIAVHGMNSEFLDGEEFELSSSEAAICSNALTAVTSWYLSKVLPNILDIFPFEIIQGKDINNEHIKQAVEIDKRTFSEDLNVEVDLGYQWFKQNPDIGTFILDKRINRVVGYINAMPLEDHVIKKIENGFSMDSDIQPEDILTYDFPDFYKLYIVGVVVDGDYKGSIAFKMLYEAFFDKLLKLARKDIYISEVIADAVTKDGEKLCKFIGMNKINETNHQSNIYKTTLLPPSIRATTKKAKNLKILYQKKYDEFRDLLEITDSIE